MNIETFDDLKKVAEEQPHVFEEIIKGFGSASQLAREYGFNERRVRELRTPRANKQRVQNAAVEQLSDTEKIIQKELTTKRGTSISIYSLCEVCDKGPATVKAALFSLKEKGIQIDVEGLTDDSLA